ncbi:transcriptional regulator SlyA [compost metagenome]
MQQLARHLGLDKSSITGLVDRAERRGLVERTVSSSDRRGFNVRATAVGWQIIHEVGEQIEHQITAMTVELTESERTQTIVLAGKILAAAAGANR